jgi:hypothetical protein
LRDGRHRILALSAHFLNVCVSASPSRICNIPNPNSGLYDSLLAGRSPS